ncbi:vacuolar protein sorting protein VPS33 [Acrasis kona]|uniref:Vacuolar protein sorting protein VPS33 n=1 Tax=Acrasis kona TaxID=1008807 RepID=A0AAW2Z096_9EUKA
MSNNSKPKDKKVQIEVQQGAKKDEKPSKRIVKSVVPKLSNSAVDASPLRAIAVDEIKKILEGIPGKKTLVIDPSIIGPLAVVVPLSILLSCGVDDKRIYLLNDDKFNTDSDCIVYLTRPRIPLMRQMASQILAINSSKASGKRIYVIFVPRRTLICEVMLEKLGVYGLVSNFHEFPLDIIPFDNDLLTMEYTPLFRDVYLEGDLSGLYFIARGIMKMQALFGGLVPVIRYAGKNAKIVHDILVSLRKKVEKKLSSTASDFASIILIDRKVDLATPLMTPFTYEGLIDHFYGINNNVITLDFFSQAEQETPNDDEHEEPKSPPPKTAPQKMPLNDDDQVFNIIRHLNFSALRDHLRTIITEIDQKYEDRKKLVSVSDIKAYFEELPEVQQKHKDLTTHTNIATTIKREMDKHDFVKTLETERNIIMNEDDRANLEYIETCIIRQDPVIKVIRLLCLMSIAKNGINQKEFDHLRTEMVHSYGHFILLTLHNLEKCGLIKLYTSRGTWPSIVKNFNLMVSGSDDKKKQDISYTHSGYAPLSVRIIEHINDWDRVASNFKGTEHEGFIGRAEQPNAVANLANNKRTHLVYFIGGCTFAEISAIKNQRNKDERFVVATTKLINSETFLASMFEQV